MKLRYTRRAEQDLARILDHVERHSRSGARNVKAAIKATAELIGEHPAVGRPASQGTRVLPVGRYPYLVYWVRVGDEVQIVHVRHAARAEP